MFTNDHEYLRRCIPYPDAVAVCREQDLHFVDLAGSSRTINEKVKVPRCDYRVTYMMCDYAAGLVSPCKSVVEVKILGFEPSSVKMWHATSGVMGTVAISASWRPSLRNQLICSRAQLRVPATGLS